MGENGFNWMFVFCAILLNTKVVLRIGNRFTS